MNVEELQKTVKRLTEALERAHGVIDELRAENASLRAENARLRARLAILESNSRNSSRPPSSDFSVQKPRPGRHKKSRPRGGKPGHRGSKRELLPDDEVSEVVSLTPQSCSGCGCGLRGEDAAPRRLQTIELPPVRPIVTEYRCHALTCSSCGKITRARAPKTVECSPFGPRLAATTATLTAGYRISKRGVQELLRDVFGVSISLGGVSRIEQQASMAVKNLVSAAHRVVQTSKVVHADETGWAESRQKSWLWLAATHRLAIFSIDPGRGRAAANRLLGDDFSGMLVTDRWSAYNAVPLCRRQMCWAHLLRDFKKWQECRGRVGHHGKMLRRLARKMLFLWHRRRDGELHQCQTDQAIAGTKASILEHLRAVGAMQLGRARGMARRILAVEPALWSFLRHPDVAPTNNHAERLLRHAVMLRRVSFGTESRSGSTFIGRMLTVKGSLRLQQRNLLDFLEDAISAFRTGRAPPSLV